MDNKLAELKKCDKCMGIGIFECKHNTSPKTNMPDIKQRAHKMFDERFIKHRIMHGGDKYPRLESLEVQKEIESFIDEIIDIAVSEEKERVVKKIKDLEGEVWGWSGEATCKQIISNL
jgi:hypothetical protein